MHLRAGAAAVLFLNFLVLPSCGKGLGFQTLETPRVWHRGGRAPAGEMNYACQARLGLKMAAEDRADDKGRRHAIASLIAGAGLAGCMPSEANAAKSPPTAAKAAAQNEKERARNLGTDKASSKVHYSPVGNACPSAIVMIAPGFLIPPFQYDSYATSLAQLGYAARILDLEDTILDTKTLSDGVKMLVSQTKEALQYEDELAFLRSQSLLSAVDDDSSRQAFMKRMMRAERDIANAKGSTTNAIALEEKLQGSGPGVLPDLPIIFVGHSRGAKHCVLAANAMKRAGRKVSAMVLYDPVDRTQFEVDSVLPVLAQLKVPTAIVGAGAEEGSCAPESADYEAFYRVLSESGTPRMLGEVVRAGHMQFLDARKALVVDPCTLGAAQDSDVREVSICVASSWLSCFSPPKSVDALPLNEQESVRRARALIPKDKKFLNFAQRASKEQLLELLESTKWGCEVSWSVELGASPEPSRA